MYMWRMTIFIVNNKYKNVKESEIIIPRMCVQSILYKRLSNAHRYGNLLSGV